MSKKVCPRLLVGILIVSSLGITADLRSGLKTTSKSTVVQDLNNLQEPGPVMFSTAVQNNQHFLGTDTASRPHVRLGVNPNTYTPVIDDTPQDLEEARGLLNQSSRSLDEIKDDKNSNLTSEQGLEYLAELFRKHSPSLEEPAVENAFEQYLNKLSLQIHNFNKDIKDILSPKKIKELAEKYPLVVYSSDLMDLAQEPEHYSDLMHTGIYAQAPDMGEMKPIEDINLGSD
jgi:hypothetical protein